MVQRLRKIHPRPNAMTVALALGTLDEFRTLLAPQAEDVAI
jgi:hypothetical protein